jgi:DNA-binding protein Fis
METAPTPPVNSESALEPSATGSSALGSPSDSRQATALEDLATAFLDGQSMIQKFREMEFAVLLVTLQKAGWNQTKAARMLGLKRSTLAMKCRKHGLSPRTTFEVQ